MASPWGKIEKIEAGNFAEIMSEEYARDLHNKEMRKCGPENIVKIFENHNDDDDKDENLKDPKERKIPEIPKDVLMAIQEDESLAEAVYAADVDGCNSDDLIARLLQSQYDHEYNNELKRIEKQRNKNSKVCLSFTKHRRDGDMESDEDEEYYDNGDFDNPKRDWDRFETNEKIFDGIPKCGFKVDKEGEMITKHDSQICGVRNACRAMSFPPEFPIGDAGSFDMKLSNSVFNKLKTYSVKSRKRNKMHDRDENKATSEMGFDGPTRLILFKLVNNKILEQVNGVISTGKEAIILHADGYPDYVGDFVLPKECVIKVFKTTLNEFKKRERYIKDDYRFKNCYSKQNKKVGINLWAEKELHNLKRMQKCGINCPNAILLKKNILVMSFIGINNLAAPKLKHAQLNSATLITVYEEIIGIMRKLFNEAKLIHADLSEYNILWMDEKCWIIDVAQSVEPEHPSALEFLMRDCDNIISFFTRRGVSNLFSKEQLFEHITGMNAEIYNASMLERIHARGESVNDATNTSNQDSIPDEFKPNPYPFEVAWEKSLQDNNIYEKELKNNGKTIIHDLPVSVVETIDALQVLKIQHPIECDGDVKIN